MMRQAELEGGDATRGLAEVAVSKCLRSAVDGEWSETTQSPGQASLSAASAARGAGRGGKGRRGEAGRLDGGRALGSGCAAFLRLWWCYGGGEFGVVAEAPDEDVAEGVGGVQFPFFHGFVEECDGVVA
jgi:hypothetical protein